MTPAQASGYPNFVDDVPVQGPTDPGIRAADCWFAQNVLPKRPACVDCMTGVGEQIFYRGFALGAPGDPDAWVTLNPAQQTWVLSTFTQLNALITKNTGTMCTGWVAPSGASGITSATGCFQTWFNSAMAAAGQPVKQLRVDGVFDEDTLCALIATAQVHAADFPVVFPDPAAQHCQSSTLPVAAKKISTGAIVGIAAAGATAVGGLIYVATRKKSKKRK